MSHIFDVRIYYEDTDAGGVVYHANYLNYAERARTEWLREHGHQNTDIAQQFNMIFVVKHIDIDYIKPAFLDDALRVVTHIKALKNSSFIMNQRILRGHNEAEEMLTNIEIVLVCVDTNTLKPVRLPDILRVKFENDLDTGAIDGR